MKEMLPADTSTSCHRLLGGWRDVLDDIRTLCQTLQDLPDECQCGHGAAHLQGTCTCCGTTATVRVPACDDCEAQLAALRPAIDALTADTFRFFPFVKELLARENATAAVQARSIEQHIATVVESFEQLVVAAGRFRTDCRTSHLSSLKDAAVALRRDAERLDRIVNPEPSSYLRAWS